MPQNKPARFSIRMHSLGKDEVIMKSLPLSLSLFLSVSHLFTRPFARYLPRRCVTHASECCVSLCFLSMLVPIIERKGEGRKVDDESRFYYMHPLLIMRHSLGGYKGNSANTLISAMRGHIQIRL